MSATIDAIVREVVRRLTQPAMRDTNPEQQAAETVEAAERKYELTLADPVVTLRGLEGRLAGIRRVRVQRRTVVTPAVLDELRGRQIELVRESSPAAGISQLLFVWHQGQMPLEWHVHLRRQFVGSRWTEESDGGQVVTIAARHVTQYAGLAVVITSAPFVLACGLNRHGGVRSAYVQDVAGSVQAIASLGANVLVFDSGTCSVDLASQSVMRLVEPRGPSSACRWLK